MPKSPHNILVLAPNWLGDAAMCTPALRALHRRFPSGEITVAGQVPVCQLLDGFPGIHRLVPLPKRPGLTSLLRLGRELRPHGRDLCIIFPHSIRAALLAVAAGARQRLAYARGNRSMLLTHAVPPYLEHGQITPRYMAFEYIDLLQPLDCEDDGEGLQLHVPEAELANVRKLLPHGRPIAGFAPGAAFGPSKRWPAERFAAVADTLHREADACCVLLTGPGEEETRSAFLQAVQVPVVECQATPPTIARLKATVSCLDILVGNDSGPRHIAIAMNKPVICVMGSTSPRYTHSPWERGEVVRIDVDCGPCQKPVCVTGDHKCMTGIAVDRVATAALNWLGSAG